MNKLALVFFLALSGAIVFSQCTYDKGPDLTNKQNTITDTIKYSKHVSKIIERRCYELGGNNCCHGTNPCNGDFTTYEGLTEDFYRKKLSDAINWEGTAARMPFGASEKISQAEIDTIDAWLNAGYPNN